MVDNHLSISPTEGLTYVYPPPTGRLRRRWTSTRRSKPHLYTLRRDRDSQYSPAYIPYREINLPISPAYREIETALDKHATLKANVVIAAELAGQPQLVAYVVAHQEHTKSLDIEGLQKHVERLCTPYMVPGIFIQLDALPLLPNGKVFWAQFAW